MKFNRRNFLQSVSLAAPAACLPLASFRKSTNDSEEIYKKLDEIIACPVLKSELFNTPIIIKDIQLLHYKGSFLCKVYSTEGHEGISVSNNIRMNFLYPVFIKRIAPYFIGKDARNLDNLIDGVYRYRSNYKFQSYALWVPVATVEFAILDMLGKIAGLPMGALFGDIVNTEVGVYYSSRLRDKSAREALEASKAELKEKGYKAYKFKIGEKMGQNQEIVAGRTEKMIPMVRKVLGDDIWLGVDANGGYDAKEGIRIGKILDVYNYDFYEEPVPFDWYHVSKEIADNVKTPVAGGEQEASMRNFRWIVADNIHQILRPDMFYFGGMLRSVKVARMANHAGMSIVPHLSGSGLGYLYVLHFVSAIPNAGDYHPNSRDQNNPIPVECKTSSLQVENGRVKVPSSPGLGVEVDPDFVTRHKPVEVI
jgi:L-alanine-DL-glutamate epimerase-like enolase superfamily enzyme